jgi:dihydrofolate synthase/folylpolyglutamate synthase
VSDPAAPPDDAARLAAVLARLDALIDWERRARGGKPAQAMRVDTGPAAALLERLGSPQRGLRVVHVAGTKGKGSVASLVEAALVAAGLEAGRFGSPHVERIHERVSLRGRPVGDGPLAEALGLALDAREAEPAREDATWFDVLTAAAVLAFREAGLGWAVLECGLGGRLDSTNALDGEVCVVTNLDLEHTEVLGDDFAAIAHEKGGIFMSGAVLLTGVPPAGEGGEALGREAERVGGELVRPPGWDAETIGERNAALAGGVLAALGERGETAPARGGRPLGPWLLDGATRERARLPGRLEELVLEGPGGPVPVVLDGAHVPSSLEAVLAELTGRSSLAGPLVAVLGCGADKDAEGLLKVLRGRADRLVCTFAGGPTGRPPADLLRLARGLGMAAESAAEPEAALRRALELCRGGGWVLVTGSLHLVGAVRPGAVRSETPGTCSRSSPTSS